MPTLQNNRFFDRQTAWKPRDNYLILKPTLEPEITSGGIVLPDMVRRKSSSGYINAMGPYATQNGEFNLGDEVFFETHSEFHILLDDTQEEAYVLDANKVILFLPMPNSAKLEQIAHDLGNLETSQSAS